ncbi:hypothetical protein FY034_10245 [Trichlorobacter lovleyi]|uniref:hypothetical protein n=1 Tax=Trichlorobacter lovleyi TaxID=313985 RepID=UPI00223EC07A|nr:hypothetical protein [Trichlorobacter lovleyi]QOX79295.1 hypothetical protein FY034_10245 [Trichlorobacter lovleyi]
MRYIHKKDPASLVVMAITLILFISALFTTGFTHDLLLETGVFLVSVKLVIMNYKNGVTADAIQTQLKEIKEILDKR